MRNAIVAPPPERPIYQSEELVSREVLNAALLDGYGHIRINSLYAEDDSRGVNSYICQPGSVKVGISDVILVQGIQPVVFAEMKATGEKQNKNQLRFEAWAQHFKLDYQVWDHVDDYYNWQAARPKYTFGDVTLTATAQLLTLVSGDATLCLTPEQSKALLSALQSYTDALLVQNERPDRSEFLPEMTLPSERLSIAPAIIPIEENYLHRGVL